MNNEGFLPMKFCLTFVYSPKVWSVYSRATEMVWNFQNRQNGASLKSKMSSDSSQFSVSMFSSSACLTASISLIASTITVLRVLSHPIPNLSDSLSLIVFANLSSASL